MTQDEIIDKDEILKMATEAGLCYESNGFIDWIDAGPSLHEMTLFAKLVADVATAKEREACAKLCEKLEAEDESYYAEFSRASDCAEVIRARGQK